MSNQKQAGGGPLGKIKIGNAIYPILIGLAVVGWMLWRDFNPEVFADIRFSWATVGWLCLAVFFMFGRDIGYIIRIRVLSGGQLSWLQSFRVIMLWEFTSAITPSAVGGTSVAIIYVHKEGISLGRSSAIVMLTSFLDEIYFIVMFPLLMLLVGVDRLRHGVRRGEGRLLLQQLADAAAAGDRARDVQDQTIPMRRSFAGRRTPG